MEDGTLDAAMIRSVLLTSALLSGLPGHSSADRLRASIHRVAASPVARGDEGWRADALKPLDLNVGGNGSEGARSVTVTVNRAALLAELPMLQEHGALSKSITGEDVAKHPASYTNALSLLLTS